MTDRSKQLTFVADGETLDTIDMLKKELGAPTAAAVFRKALVIAKLAAEQGRGSNGIVKFRGRNQAPAEEIAVALKA